MQPYCRSAELRNGFPVGDQDQRPRISASFARLLLNYYS